MLEQMAWNTFKQTGNIDTFLELIELRNIMNDQANGEVYGKSENKGDNFKRK